MKNRMVDIQIDEQFRSEAQEGWLRSAISAVLSAEGVKYPLEMSLLLTGDEKVRQLNHRYRGMDKTTDVLSFAFKDISTEDDHFPQPDKSAVQLGEVVISYPQAARQAEEEGRSVKDELSILTIHGVLHLMGYDHADPESEREMFEKQNLIASKLGGNP